MYKVNDYILYKRQVCIIKEIKDKYIRDIDYYFISPVDDDSLLIKVPISSSAIKDIISKKEALKIIDKIPTVEIIDDNEKMLENDYKELLSTDDLLDLVKIIKTTYLRNKDRVDNGKKIGDKDDTYFKKAENYLYNTLAIALGMKYEECKEYVISKVEEKIGNKDA